MSDLDDDLLALLGEEPAQPSKAKRSASPGHGPATKKRKRVKEAGSGSDMDMSSGSDEEEEVEKEVEEPPSPPPKSRGKAKRAISAPVAYSDDDAEGEDEEDDSPDKLYPLEGLYKDKQDRRELLAMNELDREAVLGTRLEEIQKLRDRQQVKQLVREKDAGVSSREARKKTTTGTSNEKTAGLAALAKKRQTKARKAAHDEDDDDGPRRARSASESDGYSEDDRKTSRRGKRGKEPIERAGRDDIAKLLLPRWRFAQAWTNPWFEEYIKGAWVRVSLGPDPRNRQLLSYNICEVVGLGPPEQQPYMLEDTVATNVTVLLRYGKSERIFRLDQISGSEMQPIEYSNLLNRIQTDGMELPSRKDYEQKRASIEKYKDYVMSESDLTASLKAKQAFKARHRLALQQLDLRARRDAARAQGDSKSESALNNELVDVKRQIAAEAAAAKERKATEATKPTDVNGAESAAPSPVKPPATPTAPLPRLTQPDEQRDALSRVNERNRKANREEVRKAELAAAARAAKAAGQGKIDPSARVRTQVRLLHDVSAGPGSLEGSRAGTPGPESQQTNGHSATSTPSKLGAGAGQRLEQQIASRVQVDLGDF